MKVTLKKKVEVDAKFLHVRAGVRYWEDASVNGATDDDGELIPCREGDDWKPKIDIETGQILNWEQGKTADIHYKICDDGTYTLTTEDGTEICGNDAYVPKCMSPKEEGFGDYIIMDVDANGFIQGWKFTEKDVKHIVNGFGGDE